jgi:hypothetical protein
MNEAYRDYLKAIQEKGADGTEFTYRTPFENLLNAVKPTDITFKVRHEPKRKKEFGAPDFLITSKGLPIGYIETKKLDEEVTDTRKTDQIAKYLKVTPNLIITNYRDFLLIKDGVDVEKVSLFGYADASKKRAKISEDDVEKLERIFSAFFESKPIEIAKVSVLAEELARRAKLLKAFIEEELKSEDKKDYAKWLEGLFEEFKRNLIGDLDEEGFADAFTQTLIYGLLLAGLDKKEPLNRITAYANIPRSFAVIYEGDPGESVGGGKNAAPVVGAFLKEYLTEENYNKVRERSNEIKGDAEESGVEDNTYREPIKSIFRSSVAEDALIQEVEPQPTQPGGHPRSSGGGFFEKIFKRKRP